MKHMKHLDKELDLSRRQFVRKSACAALGYAGIINAITQLTMVRSAIAAPLPGYKALVVLFLGGGNDSTNMIIPRMGHPEYARYKSARNFLTIFDPNDPLRGSSQVSIPLTTVSGSYGIHPSMSQVATLFDSGKIAFVANTGTLAYPILTRDDYINGTTPVPPQLFSHSDQAQQWQSSLPDKPFQSGWGGRIADLLNQPPASTVAMNISVSGINSFQVGRVTSQFSMSPEGTVNLAGYGTDYSNALNANGTYKTTLEGTRLKAFEDIMRYTHSNLLEAGYNRAVSNGRATEGFMGAALTAAAGSGVNFDAIFGTGTDDSLNGQLKMIAKLIAGRSALGNSRQIFFASIRGFDTHAGQTEAQNNLMEELSTSLKAFYDATVALGVSNDVLTLTHSDFGRTLTPNGSDPSAGSDHAWGSHHVVMGGAVQGARIYGFYPNLSIGAGLDTAQRGQLIPTTSVDQYAAVAAKWFGVGASELPTIFPNLGRFNDPFSPSANLGYI